MWGRGVLRWKVGSTPTNAEANRCTRSPPGQPPVGWIIMVIETYTTMTPLRSKLLSPVPDLGGGMYELCIKRTKNTKLSRK